MNSRKLMSTIDHLDHLNKLAYSDWCHRHNFAPDAEESQRLWLEVLEEDQRQAAGYYQAVDRAGGHDALEAA